MATPVKELVRDLSKEGLYDDFVQIGDALGLPASLFEEGEPLWGLLQIFAERFANLWNGTIAPAIRAAFLDHAEGDWLTLKTSLDYETDRKEDAFAAAKLTVRNTGFNFYTLLVGAVRIKNGDGKTFRNVTGGTLAAWGGSGPFPSIPLTFEADEAGPASNTPTGGIVTTPTSAPSGVEVVTNATPILGSGRESDPALRARARLQPSTLSPAPPLSAYEYVALSTKRADSTTVDVTRAKAVDQGGGVIKVYLAGESGATAGDMSTEGSDVFLVWVALAARCLALGFTVLAYGATPKVIVFEQTITITAGSLLTTTEAKTASETAINAYFATLPIGGRREIDGGPGYVFASELLAKSSEAAEDIILARAVNVNDDPLEDIGLTEDQVAVPSYTTNVSVVKQQ
jgi:uncharacterized phage protein gp47/JayE